MGKSYNLTMRIIARSTLREFWEIHTEAEPALRAWIDDVAQANWQTPSDEVNAETI
jgi:mRNA interferase HigB